MHYLLSNIMLSPCKQDNVDVEEAECIIASVVFKKAVKAKIARQGGQPLLVFNPKDPFPVL